MKELNKQLLEKRENEFVQTISLSHTVGFAVPIYKSDKVVASLSIFVTQSRYIDSHKEKISKLIYKAAKNISERLES